MHTFPLDKNLKVSRAKILKVNSALLTFGARPAP